MPVLCECVTLEEVKVVCVQDVLRTLCNRDVIVDEEELPTGRQLFKGKKGRGKCRGRSRAFAFACRVNEIEVK